MSDDGAPSVQIDIGKFYTPVRLVCKFKVEPEIALRCQQLGGKPHRGSPIGKIVDLWPHDQIKRIALSQAKQFVGHMKNQGYAAQQAETEFELWGPYRERVDISKGTGLVNFEAGNPTKPDGVWGFAATGMTQADTRGPQVLDRRAVLENQDHQKGVVFMIRGQFLATRGSKDDATGTIIVHGE